MSLCNGSQVLTSATGILHASPPLSYGNNLLCSWHLTVAEGRKIGLSFQWFKTEPGCDFLEVQDLSTSQPMGESPYDGERQIPLLVSWGNSVNVSFIPDFSVLDVGFQIFYYTV
ncbi:CUB and sushi domain-containing protein 1-like [Macrobrachium nipponense]|uniref:CUB and sushi domain-containing protein 1-like n=1 Tax=Macrobrachium nipponense TaxID=159736 RepID=UPI0030C85FAE